MKTPFFRTPYNYDTDAASLESGVHCKDPSLVREADSVDADINVIMKRYTQSGVIPMNADLVARMPLNGTEFPDGFDFRMAQDLIAQGRQAFMALPADIRSRFQNDPAQFVEFCSDRDNLPALRKMGLAQAPQDAASAPGGSATPPPAPGGEVRPTAPTGAPATPSAGPTSGG